MFLVTTLVVHTYFFHIFLNDSTCITFDHRWPLVRCIFSFLVLLICVSLFGKWEMFPVYEHFFLTSGTFMHVFDAPEYWLVVYVRHFAPVLGDDVKSRYTFVIGFISAISLRCQIVSNFVICSILQVLFLNTWDLKAMPPWLGSGAWASQWAVSGSIPVAGISLGRE